jgi:copper oxidase (laccase) domain-containing protein
MVSGNVKRAYLGPCIRGCCYEVSPELADAFAREFGDNVVSGRQLSLPDAIRVDLERAGAEVVDLGLCTGCRPDLFFSHRKQKPLTGRSLASVVKVPR